MKIKYFFPQILLAVLLVACSTNSSKSNSPEHLAGVEIKSPTVEVKSDNVITDISDEAKPNTPVENIVISKTDIKPGINLMIGPGGYHSFSLVGFFKSLEKKHIKIKEISGIEMGGLIAALYAKHRKSSVVEWELFKLINKLDEDELLYTALWNQVMTDFIKRNFENVDFSDLTIALRLSASTKNGEVEWFDSGSVASALLESLKIKPEAFKKFIWPDRLEGEELIAVDILSSNLNFKQKVSERFYREFLAVNNEMKKQSTQTINLKFTQGYVDSYKKWQNNAPVAQRHGTQLAKILLNKSQKIEPRTE